MIYTNKKNNNSIFSWRFIFVYSFIFILLLSFMLRVAYLQVIYADRLVIEGDMRSLRIQPLINLRGMINDRTGRPLAVSIPVSAIWADPKEISKHGGILKNSCWNILSEMLNISIDQLSLSINIKNNLKWRFIYLARKINPVIGYYIYKLKLPGIYFRNEYRRYYPAGTVAANLIGITNIDSKGIEGIEKSFDLLLNGKPGKCTVRKDRVGRVIEYLSSIDSKAARNLALSIDERLQTLVYHELNNAVINNKAESGTVVLVDVNTGEVLAMANSPSYNPNNLNSVNITAMRNRAITDIFEPGSIVKPMVIISALHNGVVTENSILNTMPYIIKGHKIKDIGRYKALSLTGVLQKSSNVGVSKLALAMPSSAILDIYNKFGLCQTTNVGLVGESIGLYPHNKCWSDMERAAFSYGYGFMVTPLQLARVYATIGSMGLLRPISIKLVEDYTVTGNRVFPESVVRTVVNMMESVALPGGSGVNASINGYRIAVKTGTVKKIGTNGKYINKYIACTAGIAPASNPLFALVVVINDPQCGKYYGGTVSAPVFSTIMGGILRIMNIEPDAIKISNKLC